ncbi:hypothetical protein J6V85_03255 [Candidatus Saccharibacteria bacterium]|nr:hypothetical protein [Candidatus Saccharibacteria bacterium]
MENFNIPNNGKAKDIEDQSFDFQLIGGNEKGERDYKNATRIKKSEVEKSTLDYKKRKIGHVALFSISDKLSA